MIEFKDKTEFIYKAIDDATNNIRYIDTKVASIFVIIGLITTMFISLGKDTLLVYNHFRCIPIHGCIIGFSILLYLIAIVISAIYGFKTLKALENPCDFIKFEDTDKKSLWYLLNSSDNKISISVDEYLKKINIINNDDLIKMISIELMKVSAIRNFKIEKINKSIFWFKISFVSILVPIIYIMVYYSIY
ncbi:hypothetical protein HZF24_01550 [Sedimentibacter hydroxybenzoicus DSM 7310]|uniref:Pycsar effector protein domain-containing protein n=1 Tax=Sedimentibacter hydroxybenzoicus DSM 7310 TaxID=1123245 RepID=A0A974GV80_SEDHY|nr:hypothetical protein [Sedimentibacter hydroxybenzoicus]NYB72820.1 hypothetical protein [Sedimentibacter hydroxybenzoicus DSM 7310]